MKLREFERVARQAFDEIPEQYRQGVDGLVVSSEAPRHPHIPDVYTLGHCDTETFLSDWDSPETVRSTIVLYYGSFRRLARQDPGFDWAAEIYETVEHEVRHHLEALAGEDELEAVDYAMDESFKRAEGLPFDPWFYRRGEPVGGGAFAVEDQLFIEVEWDPAHTVPARPVIFRWQGRSYRFDSPGSDADVHFVWISEGLEGLPTGEDGPTVSVVLVRKSTWWEGARRFLRGTKTRVAESEARVTLEEPA